MYHHKQVTNQQDTVHNFECGHILQGRDVLTPFQDEPQQITTALEKEVNLTTSWKLSKYILMAYCKIAVTPVD